MVESAVNSGAKVVMGGAPSQVSPLHYQPTILTEVTDSMTLFQEEIFGPVISVKKFKTEEEALDIANDCRTGLASYFYSNDISQCWRVGKRLETGLKILLMTKLMMIEMFLGMVGINEGMISAAEAAFGGIKESGFGREGSSHGIDDYTNIKYLCFGGL